MPLTASGRSLRASYDSVLAHEHLAIDIRCWLDDSHEPTRPLRDLAVSSGTTGAIRQNPFACLDNLVLGDQQAAREELSALSDLGEALVVEVTPANVGRDVGLLARLDRELRGVDLVYGCGRYIAVSRPHDDHLTVDDYRGEILAELAAHGSRPGVIGEIGTSDPLLECERRSVIGAAEAQRETGLALYLHLDPWGDNAIEVLELATRAGADARKIVLCHLDARIADGLEIHRELMDRGATIAFDIWGDEDAYGAVTMPADAERIAALMTLIGDGYGDRIVHSHDVCTKTQLRRYGGPGYDHLPRRVRPQLAAAGLDRAELHRQLAGNALALVAGLTSGQQR